MYIFYWIFTVILFLTFFGFLFYMVWDQTRITNNVLEPITKNGTRIQESRVINKAGKTVPEFVNVINTNIDLERKVSSLQQDINKLTKLNDEILSNNQELKNEIEMLISQQENLHPDISMVVKARIEKSIRKILEFRNGYNHDLEYISKEMNHFIKLIGHDDLKKILIKTKELARETKIESDLYKQNYFNILNQLVEKSLKQKRRQS